MSKYPFSEEELNPVGETRLFYMPPQSPAVPVFRYPCSCQEAYKAAYLEKKPVWAFTGIEMNVFSPRIIPDAVARGAVYDGEPPLTDDQLGGKDIYGVEWVYQPALRASMVRPGNPLMEEAYGWEDVIHIPTHDEIDSWDWASSAERNKEYLSHDKAMLFLLHNGCWFERLVTFMDMTNALIALVDEDQYDDIKALFDKTTYCYCYLVDKIADTYGELIAGIQVHDDWGTQRAPFFRPEIAEELIVPYMKRLVDKIHERGMVAEIHSCGCNEMMVPNYIAAGWDIWPAQNINDVPALTEQYGNQICIHTYDDFDARGKSEEDQFSAGAAFAEKWCRPDRPIFHTMWGPSTALTPAYRKGFYSASRKIYQGTV